MPVRADQRGRRVRVHQRRRMVRHRTASTSIPHAASTGEIPTIINELAHLSDLLSSHPCFFDGARLTRIEPSGSPVVALRRDSADGFDTCLILVNAEFDRSHTLVLPEAVWRELGNPHVRPESRRPAVHGRIDRCGQASPSGDPPAFPARSTASQRSCAGRPIVLPAKGLPQRPCPSRLGTDGPRTPCRRDTPIVPSEDWNRLSRASWPPSRSVPPSIWRPHRSPARRVPVGVPVRWLEAGGSRTPDARLTPDSSRPLAAGRAPGTVVRAGPSCFRFVVRGRIHSGRWTPHRRPAPTPRPRGSLATRRGQRFDRGQLHGHPPLPGRRALRYLKSGPP